MLEVGTIRSKSTSKDALKMCWIAYYSEIVLTGSS